MITGTERVSPDRTHLLADRLDVGWRRIDEERDPARKARLEDDWIDLLREYAAAVDRSNEAEGSR